MVNTVAQTENTRKSPPSMPNILLHAEGLAVFITAIIFYAHQGYSGLAFIVFLLAVDLSAVGYLVNTRVGSLTYNAAHIYVVPIVIALLSLAAGSQLGLQIALIWFAHIGMDRALGFGLKYPTVFKDTHFQHI